MVQNLHDFIPVKSLKELSIYQKILDNTAIIVLADSDKHIIYVNQKFTEKSGLMREEVLGKHFDELRSEDQLSENLAEMWATLEGGNVWQGELLNKKGNGKETYWEEAVIYPFNESGSKPYQYISIGSDITQYKNAVDIKDQFLANMSHELRTPLHSIFSLSNLLEETNLSDEQSNYVENILNATDILMRMVEDMLDLNKIETGQMKFQQKIFNPQIIVNSLAKIFRQKAVDKKLRFSLSYDSNMPEFILGDPFRIKQILMHLLENAVKYTQKGEIELICKLAGKATDSIILEFTINDTGIGIAPENLNKIQEKFQQEKTDDRRIFKGQGLGLSIVKQLIELQNGELTISSQESEGTQVQFYIPYQFPQAEAIQEQKKETPRVNGVHGMKVLIAEDVDINQLVIKKHMQKFGFDADFAENGKIALDKLRNGKYDIILMDMQMPVMDGYEAIRTIRKQFPEPIRNIPIISITASVMGEAPMKCMEAGANDYVPKPYNISELKKKMETWVGRQKDNYEINTTIMEGESNTGQGSLIDLDYLNQLSEGDDDFSISMLSYFLDNTPNVIREMRQFYQEQDWKNLRNVAHKFKPQLTFMGIKSIFNEVETIEQSSAALKDTDQIPSLIEKAEKVCDKAMLEIKAELEKLLDKNQE